MRNVTGDSRNPRAVSGLHDFTNPIYLPAESAGAVQRSVQGKAAHLPDMHPRGVNSADRRGKGSMVEDDLRGN